MSLIKRTIKPCEAALKGAGLSNKSDIDEVILVGGSTRIPAVARCSKIFLRKRSLLKVLTLMKLLQLEQLFKVEFLTGEVKDVLLLRCYTTYL